MEQIMMMLSPLLVSVIAGFSKGIVSTDMPVARIAIIRLAVAILSYAAAIGTVWLNHGTIDPASATTFIDALVTFFAATGMYHVVKQ